VAELNRAIKKLLAELNGKPLQKKEKRKTSLRMSPLKKRKSGLFVENKPCPCLLICYFTGKIDSRQNYMLLVYEMVCFLFEL